MVYAMKTYFILFLFPTLLLCLSSTFTFHSMNDIHINPFYGPDIPVDQYCSRSISFNSFQSPQVFTSNSSSIGRPGCDPPYALLRLMLKKLKHSSKSPEFLLLPGDFVSHGYSQNPSGNYSALKFEILKEILRRSYLEIRYEMPETYLFPSIGNNDVEFHYQVPTVQDKNEYYTMLFEIWFKDNAKNMQLKNIDEIKTDFLNGGYYKADLSDNFSVIVLNTLYYSSSNNNSIDPETGETQIKWLETKLKETKQKNGKVIMVYHIFPGLNYYNGIQYFLNKTANEQIQTLFFKYKDFIVLNVASHIHMNGFRVDHLENNSTDPEIENQNIYGHTIISGSLSPVFYNNPSFLTINIEEFQPKNAIYSYFRLNEFLNQTNHEEMEFKEINSFFFDYDLNSEYGIADIGAKSLSELVKKFSENEEMFRKFLVLTYGSEDNQKNREFILGMYASQGMFLDSGNWTFNEKEKRKYLCTLIEMGGVGFDKCITT